jgi:hypothetical protein
MKPKDFPLLCYWLRVDAKESLADSSLNEGRGVVANGGPLIDDEDQDRFDASLIDEIEPPPKAREPQSYFEAAYGDTQ